MENKIVKVYVLKGSNGTSLAIENYRVSNEKIYGMLTPIHTFEVATDDILQAIGQKHNQHEWIPTSERLPKLANCYNVTRLIDGTFISDVCFFDGIDTWHNDNRINHDRENLTDIVAWMELPAPYETRNIENE